MSNAVRADVFDRVVRHVQSQSTSTRPNPTHPLGF